MKTTTRYIGIDIGKNQLDIFGIKIKQTKNTPKGHAEIIKQMGEDDHVILEASGGYEKALWLALLRAGKKVTRVKANKVRHFAKSKGQAAKTDEIDAKMLSEYGATFQLVSDTLPSEKMLRLQNLMAAREQYIDNLSCYRVQLKLLTEPDLIKDRKVIIKILKKQVAKLEVDMLEVIKSDAKLDEKYQRLMQIKGVGKITSMCVIAWLNEAGTLDDEQLSSLVGVAPYSCDSATKKGHRTISGGRIKVRNIFYMAALVASRRNKILREFYLGLIRRGKAKKVALVAVMRKLVCLVNKVLKDPDFKLQAA